MRRAAAVLLLPLALVACSGDSDPNPPVEAELSAAEADACTTFLDALPATLLSGARTDEGERTTSYGDVVVTCGVEVPDGFVAGSECDRADGVDWYAAPGLEDDQDLDATITAVSYLPRVAVTVPADKRPEGPAAAMSELAPVITQTLTAGETCL
jgi:hypothetical protein